MFLESIAREKIHSVTVAVAATVAVGACGSSATSMLLTAEVAHVIVLFSSLRWLGLGLLTRLERRGAD